MDKDFKVKKGLVVAENIGVGTDTPNVSIDASGRTDAIHFPSGNTAQRPAGANGMIRFNTTTGEFEGYSLAIGGWSQLSLAGSSIDADFLSSQPGTYYNDLTNATGTLPGAQFNDTSHGNRAGGSLHVAANSTVSGFMSNTDKVKMDSLASNANTFVYNGVLGTVDLDAVTVNGFHYQTVDANATAPRHYPEVQAGMLHVTSTGVFIVQTYYTNSATTNAWHRRYNGSAWTAWKRLYDDVNLTGAVALSLISAVDGAGSGLDADVLDGQQGSYYLNAGNFTGTLPNARLDAGAIPLTTTVDGATDLNTLRTAGWYGPLIGPNNPNSAMASTYFHLLVTTFPPASAVTQILYPYALHAGAANQGNIWIRGYYSSVWSAWKKVAFSDVATTGADGLMSAADKTKLNGVETGATADMTATEIRTALLTVDGSGSGLDADLLDGQDSTYYTNIPARLGYTPVNRAGDTFTSVVNVKDGVANGYIQFNPGGPTNTGYISLFTAANVRTAYIGYADTSYNHFIAENGRGWNFEGETRFAANSGFLGTTYFNGVAINGPFSSSGKSGNNDIGVAAGGLGEFEVRGNGTGGAFISLHRPGAYAIYLGLGNDNNLRVGGWSMGANSHVIWHSGIDGAGSGLDADLLDGQQGSYYTDIPARLGYVPITVYTGTDGNETVFPIGHMVGVATPNTPSRNTTATVYINGGNSWHYTLASTTGGAALAGTWMSRSGNASSNLIILQRVA